MGSTKIKYNRSLVWFRRDLRVDDNLAIKRAIESSSQIYFLFVFDRQILDRLSDKSDRRVHFIWHSVRELKELIKKQGGFLNVEYGFATEIVGLIAKKFSVNAVFYGEDYDPFSVRRDKIVRDKLEKLAIDVVSVKDHVLKEKSEVMTAKGLPYTVFTPYKNAWLKKPPCIPRRITLDEHRQKLYDPRVNSDMPSLKDMGFSEDPSCLDGYFPGESGAKKTILNFKDTISSYNLNRNYPALNQTSRISVHLRFGTISVRTLYRLAIKIKSPGSEAWLNELIWRDFYFNIVYHFPHVTKNAFKKQYDNLIFPNCSVLFKAWCQGRTGFPIVDAGMRQLNETGYMHNRLRMITASFLVKDLHVDWRWGERYFAEKLIDYDLSANNGGWQWAASTGCDSQPYFRIFNPVLQSKRFDKDGVYIKKFVPELKHVASKYIHAPWLMSSEDQGYSDCKIGYDYPSPVVNHDEARRKALSMYKSAKI